MQGLSPLTWPEMHDSCVVDPVARAVLQQDVIGNAKNNRIDQHLAGHFRFRDQCAEALGVVAPEVLGACIGDIHIGLQFVTEAFQLSLANHALDDRIAILPDGG